MRVGISCLNHFADYVGGINTFTLGLLRGFAALSPENEYVIFVRAGFNETLFEEFKEIGNFRVIAVDYRETLLRTRLEWRCYKYRMLHFFDLLDRLYNKKIIQTIEANCDILYFPNTILVPLNVRKKKVLSMHDIQQVKYPSFFTLQEINRRFLTYLLSAKKSECIQASSDFMQGEFLSYFKFLRKEQVARINEGVELKSFKGADFNAFIHAKYQLPHTFILFPAQLWAHKNHITVFRAIHLLKTKWKLDVMLVLTGGKFHGWEQLLAPIDQLHLQENVRYLGKVPKEDLISLYKKAHFVLSPSLYESSSLPVLEAAAVGSAIIASDIQPNIEMSKNRQLNLFRTDDAEDLAQLIAQIWSNQEQREAQIKHNLQAVEQYDWKCIAQQYNQLFKNILA